MEITNWIWTQESRHCKRYDLGSKQNSSSTCNFKIVYHKLSIPRQLLSSDPKVSDQYRKSPTVEAIIYCYYTLQSVTKKNEGKGSLRNIKASNWNHVKKMLPAKLKIQTPLSSKLVFYFISRKCLCPFTVYHQSDLTTLCSL